MFSIFELNLFNPNILEEITRFMIRNPKPEGPLTIFTGSSDEYDMSKFVNVPVKKGSDLDLLRKFWSKRKYNWIGNFLTFHLSTYIKVDKHILADVSFRNKDFLKLFIIINNQTYMHTQICRYTWLVTTTWKVSVCGVYQFYILPQSNWIQRLTQ